MDTLSIRELPTGVSFAVKVVPRARRDEIAGVEGDAIKIKLNALPVEGKANEALCKFLGQALRVRRADVEIIQGESSRHKVVRVRGIEADRVRRLVEGK